MKVLIIARGYPTSKYKMNGIFEFDQAKALANVGVDVLYAAVDIRSLRRWRKWGIERKTIEGVKVYAINIPLGNVPGKIKHIFSVIALKILYSIIVKEQGRPIVLHAHFAEFGYVASKIKRLEKEILVITEHLSTLMCQTINKRVLNMTRNAYESSDAVIAVSPQLVSVIKEKFCVEAYYIPNIVDTELFEFCPDSNNEKKGTFEFISVGGLIPRKRMDLLIEAFAQTFRYNEDVSLTIFGEGSERAKLEMLIEQYEIGDRIKLLGLKSRKEIALQLKHSDCFVLLSQAETFGVAYIEALSCGVPIIATMCGGPECFISEKNGVMVPINDAESIKQAMMFMYKKHCEFDRRNISLDARRAFSGQSVAKKIIGIYRKSLESKRTLF